MMMMDLHVSVFQYDFVEGLLELLTVLGVICYSTKNVATHPDYLPSMEHRILHQ